MKIQIRPFILGLLLASAIPAAQAGSQAISATRSATRAATTGAAIKEATTQDSVQLEKQPLLARVPDVVGLPLADAQGALRRAGFEPKEVFEDEPDASIPYGHVRAMVPAAGALAADSAVELQIPRAASRLGIGTLGLSDLERRAGFDLDEGRYEEIFRGADLVVRMIENEPTIAEDGHTYYAGGGLYVEPSDGAVLALLNDEHVAYAYGLGSYPVYAGCARALKQARRPRIEVLNPNGGVQTFCMSTSKQQMLAVQFLRSDNDNFNGKLSNYKFRHALFPRQLGSQQLQTREMETRSYR